MAENYPTAKISNGIIKLKVYIPNIKTGFYRSPRFDWSGLIGIINYNGNGFIDLLTKEAEINEKKYNNYY
jgi:hypothetical protein